MSEPAVPSLKFPSERDTWVLVVMGFAFLILLGIGLQDFGRRAYLAGLFPIAIAGLFPWLIFGTYYLVTAEELIVRSGPLRIVVPITQISEIQGTRTIMSGPALSLKRLRIDYGYKFLLVSPADQQGFVEALRRVNPQIRYIAL